MKTLIPDIKPTPTKDRSSSGKTELVLDEGTRVLAVGLLYGLEHEVRGEGFRAKLFLDQYSQRIKIISYEATDYEAMILKIRWIAEANGFDKIIAMAKRSDWQKFLRMGYVLEAVLKYFYKGEDAYVVSKFRSQERITSHNLMDEMLLIEDILRKPLNEAQGPRPEGFEFRKAKRQDIPALLDLYHSIFDSYPSPLIHSEYLETVFGKETLFVVATKESKIVAAASAELYPENLSAELTDCATNPQFRGQGLMSVLLHTLEEDLYRKNYICTYTMSRARSFGMNNAFYQLGYEFLGRLVNNCDIYGTYEDMNIWVKNLKDNPPPAPQ